ncbi:MAG: hypothetical protein Q9202_000747 [Teloschistes flavicans]
MGYKHDQNHPSPTLRAGASADDDLPPPYPEDEGPTSKTEAQPSPDSETNVISSNFEGSRSLLLVYVHGFMGNETSFQQFPTHVHNLLNKRLADRYAVQSIVYPKYKSRKKIDFARDELVHCMGGLLVAEVALSVSERRSEANTRYRIVGTVNLDTPFLGMHPGIVVSGLSSLFRPTPEHSDSQELSTQGRQLELRPSSDSSSLPISEASSTFPCSPGSTLHHSPSTPSIEPDSSTPIQPDRDSTKQSTWSKAFYFFNKHSGDLTKATRTYFTSHLEFGGCLADPKGLMSRYSRIIALDEDARRNKVRFVNYYTASTGRPKKSKTPNVGKKGAKPKSSDNETERLEREARSLEEAAVDEFSNQYLGKPTKDNQSQMSTSAAEGASQETPEHELELALSNTQDTLDIPDLPPVDISLQTTQASSAAESSTMEPSSSPVQSTDDLLPPLPNKPTEPPPFDPTSYIDKDILKVASRDHARLVKAYQRALKDRDKAVTDRRKVLAKRAKDKERKSKNEAKKTRNSIEGPALSGPDAQDTDEMSPQACPLPTIAPSSSSSLNPNPSAKPPPPPPPASSTPPLTNPAPPSTAPPTSPKLLPSSPQSPSAQPPFHHPTHPNPSDPPKTHQFCLLPPKTRSGDRDPHWIRIFMPGVDEVGAHCGLFDAKGQHYEGLVGDVVERVEGWVRESEGGRE